MEHNNKKAITAQIITLEGVAFSSGGILSATIPTSSVEITVMPDHIPLISVIKGGLLTLRSEREKLEFSIGKGVLEFKRKNTMVILADSLNKR